MFVFHCHKCTHSFKVGLENFVDKPPMACPDCGQPFPDKALACLRNLSQAYRSAIDEMKLGNRYREGWSVTAAEHPYHRPQPIRSKGAFFEPSESYWTTDYDEEISTRPLPGKK